MEKISEMQEKIYTYVASFVNQKGYPPTVREIGAAVGLKSPSTVHFHLKHLEEAGMIEKASGKGRAISLTGPRNFEGQKPKAHRVPVVGNVAAGSPILAQESVEDYLVFDAGAHEDECFALRVRGDSMINAGILPEDMVVVQKQEDAANGEIVVALLGEEATVKRLCRKDGQIWLLPENENYQPIDGTDARILGRVIAVVRRY